MLSPGRGIEGLDRLDVRLVALLGLALLPIGLIAMVQTYRVIAEADRNAEAALTGATLSAATAEREGILRVRGAAQLAAKVVPILLADRTSCSERLSEFVTGYDGVTFAGYVSPEGIVECGSDGAGADVTETQIYRTFRENPAPSIDAVIGQISNRSVIVVTEPVEIDGRQAGYVALSVPQQALEVATAESLGLKPIYSMTFTTDGLVLWAPEEAEGIEAELPADRALETLAGEGPRTVRAQAVNGHERVYSVAPLVPGEVYALAIWLPDATRTSGLTAASAILFPLLMWLVSIGVAYFAVHGLVVRHIRDLRQRIRAFTANRRVLEPVYGADMPSELREVSETFRQMTERIVRDEAEQENSLHEKDVLLKEVHHRVKNNLQLIASMTNMQLRKAQSAETRFVLRRLQDRVLGLATIHRNLYQATVLSRVNSGRLIEELMDQSLRNSEVRERGVDVRTEVDDIPLYPDQAVPLSLLVTETITNALKYVGRPAEGPPWIEMSLKEGAEERVTLHVANSCGTPLSEDAGISTGLGTQLITAFAMQLDAELDMVESDDVFAVDAVFRRSDFGAEA